MLRRLRKVKRRKMMLKMNVEMTSNVCTYGFTTMNVEMTSNICTYNFTARIWHRTSFRPNLGTIEVIILSPICVAVQPTTLKLKTTIEKFLIKFIMEKITRS